MSPCLRENGGSEAGGVSTLDQGDGGEVDDLDDGLAHLKDLDVNWGFDPDAFMQERAQQAPGTGEAGDETPETMGSCQGGAVDASSAPRRGAETAETMGSSRGGAVDVSSVPAGTPESNPGAASASATGQGDREDPPAGMSGRPAHELRSWVWLPPTVRGRAPSQNQRAGWCPCCALGKDERYSHRRAACGSVRVVNEA